MPLTFFIWPAQEQFRDPTRLATAPKQTPVMTLRNALSDQSRAAVTVVLVERDGDMGDPMEEQVRDTERPS